MMTKVKFRRLEAGYTQRRLASEAGLSGDAVIVRIEHGQFPRPGTIKKLAMALGIAPKDLITTDTDPDADGPSRPLTLHTEWGSAGRVSA